MGANRHKERRGYLLPSYRLALDEIVK